MRGSINGLSDGENDIIRRNLTTPPTDTAREVIERHLAEWRETRDRFGSDYGCGGFNALSDLLSELDATPADDTQQPVSDAATFSPTTNEASTWNGDREAFDPLRAGMDMLHTYGDGYSRTYGDGVATIDIPPDDGAILAEINVPEKSWREGAIGCRTAAKIVELRIPSTNPDGTPRSHADVLHILRANGYEGGGDE